MKNFFFIIATIFLQQQLLAQQEIKDEFKYKISYKLTYQPDSTDIESRKQEEMFLYIGDGFSRFSSAGKAIGDSLKAAFDYANFNQQAFSTMKGQIPKSAFEYYLYKGIPAGKITYTREFIEDKFRYVEKQDRFDWTIHNERDTIAGFQVQKATTNFAGRNYIAWFTEEIPFPEGPYKFSGLPGLIVKIKDVQNYYIFELIEITKLKNPVPIVFQKEEFIETTKNKLEDLEYEFKRDPVGFMNRSMPDASITIQYNSKEQKNKIERERKEKLRKQNNPLELK